MHPEFNALLETVGENGEFIDTINGRIINPGHCIETAWFILEESRYRGWDKEMLETALTILDWSWEWGWDKDFGGIINFRDCRNLPVQDYSQDMKFWWPQTEAIIATLYAYEATGDEKCTIRLVIGHMHISRTGNTENGTGICIATAVWPSPPRGISSKGLFIFPE